MRVLLLCDDKKFNADLEYVLKSKNADVKVLTDGIEGLSSFLNEDFDVTVLDTDIQQLAENNDMVDFLVINSKLRDKKMILITGSHKTKKDVDKFYGQQIYSCFMKPVEPGTFASIIMGDKYFPRHDSFVETKFTN